VEPFLYSERENNCHIRRIRRIVQRRHNRGRFTFQKTIEERILLIDNKENNKINGTNFLLCYKRTEKEGTKERKKKRRKEINK
jgi:hypothetical protein